MTESKALRQQVLQARNRLSQEELRDKSDSIRQSVLSMPEISASNIIFLYVSFRSEVMTMELLHQLLALGKTVTVPITMTEEKRLDAIQIIDPETELVPGYCNIPEPREDLLTSRYRPPQTIDAIILPGSVFDERCGRFGYGGGFYDRFVSQIPTAKRIGLAFELQIVERAPLQDHDELLDAVVTEERIIRGQRGIA